MSQLADEKRKQILRYVTPDFEGNTIAYKGRRYWLVELEEDGQFQCVDTSVADYVVFDRLDDAPIGRVTRIPGGGFEVSTIMGFEGPEEVDTLKEAVQVAARLADEELKACL